MYKDTIPVKIVVRDFTFEASHRLVFSTKGDDAKRWHGHTYQLEVEVEGVPNQEDGAVISTYDLTDLVNEIIINQVNFSNLNNVMPRQFSLAKNTTNENIIIAFWYALDHEISDRFEGVKLTRVRLYEGANYAELKREMIYNEN